MVPRPGVHHARSQTDGRARPQQVEHVSETLNVNKSKLQNGSLTFVFVIDIVSLLHYCFLN